MSSTVSHPDQTARLIALEIRMARTEVLLETLLRVLEARIPAPGPKLTVVKSTP